MENTDQAAQPQSLEDKLANMFGGYGGEEKVNDTPDGTYLKSEEQEEPEAKAEESAPEEEEIEFDADGETIRVPKKLEPHLMRQADYTRKTQELAEARKSLEQAQSSLNLATKEREFAKSVEPEAQQIAQLDSYLQHLKGQNFNEMPVEEGFRQWMLIQQASDQRKALQESVEQKRAAFMRDFDEAVESQRSKVREVLSKQLPGFSDAAIATLKEYAKAQGFTDAAFDNIALDAKSMAVVYKAAQYDKLLSEKTQAVQKATPAVKPGASNPMPQQVKDKLAFHKAMKSAKTSQDKARLIEQKLMGMF